MNDFTRHSHKAMNMHHGTEIKFVFRNCYFKFITSNKGKEILCSWSNLTIIYPVDKIRIDRISNLKNEKNVDIIRFIDYSISTLSGFKVIGLQDTTEIDEFEPTSSILPQLSEMVEALKAEKLYLLVDTAPYLITSNQDQTEAWVGSLWKELLRWFPWKMLSKSLWIAHHLLTFPMLDNIQQEMDIFTCMLDAEETSGKEDEQARYIDLNDIPDNRFLFRIESWTVKGSNYLIPYRPVSVFVNYDVNTYDFLTQIPVHSSVTDLWINPKISDIPEVLALILKKYICLEKLEFKKLDWDIHATSELLRKAFSIHKCLLTISAVFVADKHVEIILKRDTVKLLYGSI